MDNETLRVGVKRLVYNKTMRDARERLNLSQKRLGEVLNMPYQYISRIEIFKDVPTVNQAIDIAEVLESTPEVLFPTNLYIHLKEKVRNLKRDAFIDITPVMLTSGEAQNYLTSGNEDFDAKLDAEMQIKKHIHRLQDRERRVISLRFGLEDGRTRTYEETGKEFGVTRERIRQVEAKALKKLRDYLTEHKRAKFKLNVKKK